MNLAAACRTTGDVELRETCWEEDATPGDWGMAGAARDLLGEMKRPGAAVIRAFPGTVVMVRQRWVPKKSGSVSELVH